jgi:hypothetical protein
LQSIIVTRRETAIYEPSRRAWRVDAIGSSAAERDLCSARDEPALRRRPLALALVTTVAVL